MNPWGYISIGLVVLVATCIILEQFFRINKMGTEIKILKLDLSHAENKARYLQNDNTSLQRRVNLWRSTAISNTEESSGKCKDLWD